MSGMATNPHPMGDITNIPADKEKDEMAKELETVLRVRAEVPSVTGLLPWLSLFAGL